jgi:hypothetical protein
MQIQPVIVSYVLNIVNSDSHQNLLLCKLLQKDSLVASTPDYDHLFTNDAENQLRIDTLPRENFKTFCLDGKILGFLLKLQIKSKNVVI